MELQIGPVHLSKLSVLKAETNGSIIHAHIETFGNDNPWKGVLVLNEQEIQILHNTIHRGK